MSSFFKRFRSRDKPQSRVCMCDVQGWKDMTCSGYTDLAHNPEICAAVDRIASLIGSMTIYLMQNTDGGDVRVKNGLSRVVDIEPNEYMGRSNFIQWIVKTMLLDGRGNAVVLPKTRKGLLKRLDPIPSAFVSFVEYGERSYKISISGKEYDPKDVLHFAINPDSYYPWKGTGYSIALADVANNLKQAASTEKGFMQSEWKPSLIVKVDAMIDEFSSPEGRAKLLDEFASSNKAGEPWLIPAEQFSVEQVRPLTLSDLALADFVKLDKTTVATILGVPPFVLGVGEFKRDEWNNFISSRIMPVAQILEQEFSRKLLYSPDFFFRFNVRSLYNYSLEETIKAGAEMVDRMAMTRNEWRSWIGLPPSEGMDELLALENYIPVDRLGDQKKLNGGGE
nr:MAG TPA: portal protein [Caudoviricetes sp.]